MSRSGDRRHGSFERGSSENEKPSPLRAGWPPLTDLYSRTSEDLSEPPLVKGRLLSRELPRGWDDRLGEPGPEQTGEAL